MRLLHATKHELQEFHSPNIPPYAILSHTWHEEEVRLQDVCHMDGATKKGFDKIRQCCAQARKDGIDWVWVDTCCIDKTSSAELSEAINSMYRWYQSAEVCYAYLIDLPPQDPAQLNLQAFKSAAWFTRGWTLQELIAPRVVQFYDRTWTMVGTRSQLRDSIYEVTGIRKSVLLQRKPPTAVSVAERMSWAARRSTTREEDIAYCLLGILNIHMPLIYGEGSRAFIRLQEAFLRTSEDLTILLWSLDPKTTPESESEESGVLAPTPAAFGDIKVVDTEGRFMMTLNNDWDSVKAPQNPLSPLRHLRGPSWRAEEGHVPAPPSITARGLHVELILLVLPSQPGKYYAWAGRIFSEAGNPALADPKVGYLCFELCAEGQAFRVSTEHLLYIDKNGSVEYARLWPLYLATEYSPERRYIDNGVDSETSTLRSLGPEIEPLSNKNRSKTWFF